MKTYKVRKGDSTLNLKAVVPSYPTLDGNWTCQTLLLEDNKSPDLAITTKVVERRSDLSGFDVNFTPSETAITDLKEGKTYFWQTTVANATLTPPYSKTLTHKLEIEYKGG